MVSFLNSTFHVVARFIEAVRPCHNNAEEPLLMTAMISEHILHTVLRVSLSLFCGFNLVMQLNYGDNFTYGNDRLSAARKAGFYSFLSWKNGLAPRLTGVH